MRTFGHPVAHGLVDRVLERARARVDAAHLRTEQTHPGHVRRLARHVLRPHVDDALEAEQGAHRGGRDAVLARPGLGHDPRLAHALHQQRLAERVVDLVRTGVTEVLALQVDAAAEPLREPRGEAERGRPPDVVTQQAPQLGLEIRVAARRLVRELQLVQRLHQRLRHVAPAVRPEVTGGVRPDTGVPCACVVLMRSPLPSPRSAPPRRRPGSCSGSLRPGKPFDAARHVDGVGPHRTDGLGHVVRAEPTRQHQERHAARETRDERPVEGHARPARVLRLAGRPRVDEDAGGLAGEAQRVLGPEALSDAHRLDHAPRQAVERLGRLVAVELQHVETHLVGDPRHLVARRVHEDPDAQHGARQLARDRGRSGRIHVALAHVPEDEAERVGPGLDGTRARPRAW